MTLTHLIKQAEKEYWRFDRNRNRTVQRRQIMQLYQIGWAPADVAATIGCSSRQIHHITAHTAPDGPETPFQPDLSDERVTELEHIANLGLELACRLRDQDPQIVSDVIAALTPAQHHDLTMALLAAIPTDQTKKQLYSWVYDLAEKNSSC